MDVKPTLRDGLLTLQAERPPARWTEGPFPRTARVEWSDDAATFASGTSEEGFVALPPEGGGACDLVEIALRDGSAVGGFALTERGQVVDEALFCADGTQPPREALERRDAEKRELHFTSHGVSLRLCQLVLASVSNAGESALGTALALLQAMTAHVVLRPESGSLDDATQKLVRHS